MLLSQQTSQRKWTAETNPHSSQPRNAVDNRRIAATHTWNTVEIIIPADMHSMLEKQNRGMRRPKNVHLSF
jgi:hypothetical protein